MGTTESGFYKPDNATDTELLEMVRSALGNYAEAPSHRNAQACVLYLIDLIGAS